MPCPDFGLRISHLPIGLHFPYDPLTRYIFIQEALRQCVGMNINVFL